MTALLLWIIISLLFLVGLAGTIIPLVPGLSIIIAGVLLFAFITKFAEISVVTVVILTIIALLASLIDFYAGAIGAKAAGGGKYAAIGATLGAIIGFIILFGPIGLLVGGFSGALLGALLEGRNTGQAHYIALVSLVGTIGASATQFVVGIIIIVTFLMAILV